MRVLLIEDDHVLGSAINDYIIAEGHGVDWMKRLDEAQLALDTTNYELILLDLGLPDGRGLDLLKSLRAANNQVPVIITTAQDQVAVRIEGLNSGADDYLVKPFDLGELSARLSAVARRYSQVAAPQITIADLSIDLSRKSLRKNSKAIILTSREWAVLTCLLRKRGAIVAKADIENSLYAFGAEVASNAVEVYVSRLRKKLGKDFITTIRSMGYQIE